MWGTERVWIAVPVLCVACVAGPANGQDTGEGVLTLVDPWLESPEESFANALAVWEHYFVFSDPEDYREYTWRPNGPLTATDMSSPPGGVQYGVPDLFSEQDVGFGWTLEALGDVTGDGLVDLAVGYRDLGRIELATDPDSEGERYGPHVLTGSSGRDRVAACGDLDGSGGDDLCTTAGVWAGPVGAASAPSVSWDPAVALVGADVLGDGARDLVVADAGLTLWWLPAVLASVGHHALAELAAGSVTMDLPVTALAAADFDGDGADEVAVGTASGLIVGRFDATGAWTELAAAPLPVDTLAVGDFDADGVWDLAIGGGAEVSWVAGPLHTGLVPVRTWRGAGYDFVGRSLAAGDWDGDGTWELAIGSPNPDPDGPSALWLLEEP